MTLYSTNPKPNLVTAIAVMTLISGIVNIFWGLIASVTVLSTLIGAVCMPFTALPTILGIFEIIYAAKLLGTVPQPVRPGTTLAALEIATILMGNAFSMIVGILSLVFYNDLVVKAYFAELNAAPGTSTVLAPAVPVPALSPEEPDAPVSPGEPEDPDAPGNPRRPRKVA